MFYNMHYYKKLNMYYNLITYLTVWIFKPKLLGYFQTGIPEKQVSVFQNRRNNNGSSVFFDTEVRLITYILYINVNYFILSSLQKSKANLISIVPIKLIT